MHPSSIVVVGGSNIIHKPSGAIVRNLLSGHFEGTLRIVNPKEDEVQEIKAFHATSLIRKGCRIAAIKAGSSESGSRAARILVSK